MKALPLGIQVMANVKVFVHANDTNGNMDTDVGGRAMTLAPQTYLSWLGKKLYPIKPETSGSHFYISIENISYKVLTKCMCLRENFCTK